MRARRAELTTSYVLSAATTVTMAVTAATGVLAPSWLYRDNALVSAAFRGQDVVTLVVAVPLLVVGLVAEVRGSARGRVLWLGMLFYAVYGYLFYAMAAAFNPLFLLYVATVALPLYALLFSVPRLDLVALGEATSGRVARVVAIAYTGLMAAGLGLLWIGMSLGSVASGTVPQPIVASGHPTGVVFAIDLVLLVPPLLLAAVWLAQRRPLGWVLAGVMSVGGSVYTLALAGASVEVARRQVGAGAELPLWAALTTLGALTSTLLLVGLRPDRVAEHGPGPGPATSA